MVSVSSRLRQQNVVANDTNDNDHKTYDVPISVIIPPNPFVQHYPDNEIHKFIVSTSLTYQLVNVIRFFILQRRNGKKTMEKITSSIL